MNLLMLYNSLVIAGPTGVGKTALSLKLAKILGCEIISADSMQVYKGLDIGTAKIKIDDMQGIKHHMLDVVNPDVDYSVGDYEKAVNNILNNKDKKYMLVGGTGLYISSITDGFSILPSRDEKLRSKLESRDLEELYKIIDKRIDVMLENGLLEEARYIHETFPNNKAIGYKELFDYFDGKSNLKEAVDLLKRRTRNYAKRQITWFKNHSDYNIYNLSVMSEDEIIEDILKKMR